MKISIFSLMFKERSLEDAIELSAKLGYDGIELWGGESHFPAWTSLERAKEIRSMLDYHNLYVPCIGAYTGGFSTMSDEQCEKELEDLEKYLCLMDVVKCDIIRVACGGPNAFEAEKYHYQKAVYWIQKAADLAKQHGKKIAMEIHNGNLIETVEAAKTFIDMVDRENAGLIHDAANMYITDTDYGSRSVEVLKDKIYHVHVKDLARVNDDSLPGAFRDRTVYGTEIFQQKLMGEGAVDHVPLFKALMKIGYDGYLSAECHAQVPDERRAAQEIREIRKQLDIAQKDARTFE